MRIIGLVVLAVGIVLLLFGLNSSESLPEKVVENVTGRYTSETMWYIVGGVAMIVGGGALFVFNRNKE